ncbi:MAG: cyclic nucleotide-binding domain-containing protein [Spirochaetales bacterium]|uniref:Cyclic nucleotide-binding domain-containing protein n=1 Tax=Candidatus Thalassospirochaeta sargassi TaxID=3119039 RepID=A0AAJ1IK11_9SPIO|nr:cyclic nucleotide-binding domain-containing protein [Spirochaetales bacterium]
MDTRLVRFNKGDVIFKSGETSRNMYIIRTGTAKVLIEKEGRQIPITELGKGQYVGEMSFLTGVKRSATVIAETNIMANEIPPNILDDEHLGLSSWAVSIAKVLVRRIRTTTEQLGEYMIGHETPTITEAQAAAAVPLPDRSAVRQEQARRLFLKGKFTEKSIDPIKNKIRELKLKPDTILILDFSDVIDIDQAGINYIFSLIKSNDVAENRIRIENMQLIRDKVLSIQGLQNIMAKTHIPIKHVDKGELLIKQGALEHVMYVVKNGSFTISRETETGTIQLAKAESGDVIGEMSLIKEGIRSADVIADKPGTVHVLDVRDFYNNVYNVPGWFLELIRGLVQRLRNTNEMLIRFERGENLSEPLGNWNLPLGIVLDSTKPGKFALSGVLNLPNIQYLVHLLKYEMMKKRKEIILDMSKVTKIDPSARAALQDVYQKMRRMGTDIKVRAPEENVEKLFK